MWLKHCYSQACLGWAHAFKYVLLSMYIYGVSFKTWLKHPTPDGGGVDKDMKPNKSSPEETFHCSYSHVYMDI